MARLNEAPLATRAVVRSSGRRSTELELHRAPGLDGLRGLAVLLVVGSHTAESVLPLGGIVGVTTFFVLSGFLITRILLTEVASTGRIRWRAFVLRRVRRLVPAYAVVLVVTPLLLLLARDPSLAQHWRPLVFAGTHTADFARAVGVDMGVLAHTWSLSVEEQFYLVWPPLVILLVAIARRRRAVAVGAFVGLLVAALLWRGVANVTMPYDWVAYSLDTSVYALLLGCAVAVAERARAGESFGPRTAGAVGWCAVLLLVLGSVVTLLPWGAGVPGLPRWIETGAAVLAAAAILPIVRGAVLPLRAQALRWFGTISYGLYLWHFVLLSVRLDAHETQGPVRAVIAVLAIGIAAVSWYALERPILRAGPSRS